MDSKDNITLTCESFEYRTLGKLRFIGIDARLNESWEALWECSDEFLPVLDDMMLKYGTDIPYNCAFMHHNGNEVDTENHYLAGRFFMEATPVPEGFDYYDVPTEQAAYATYITSKFDGDIGSAYYHTRDQILSDGVCIPYPHSYWHASVYIEGRPEEGTCRFGYLFSIEK